jgi:hypothetical protein
MTENLKNFTKNFRILQKISGTKQGQLQPLKKFWSSLRGERSQVVVQQASFPIFEVYLQKTMEFRIVR